MLRPVNTPEIAADLGEVPVESRPAHQPQGHGDRGETCLGRHQRALRFLDQRQDVGLDLAALHRDNGEWPELEAIAADTYQRFKRLSGNTEAVAALSLCVTAARARRGAGAAITTAQDVIAARMARP